MGAPKLVNPESNLYVSYSKENTSNDPAKIDKSINKLDTEIHEVKIPTKESLSKLGKNSESREISTKNTDNNMGKGGGSSSGSSNSGGKIVSIESAKKKTTAQMEILEKSGLELDKHGEVAETHLQTWNNEKLLAAKIEEIEKTSESLKKHKGLIKYFAGKGASKIPEKPVEIMNKMVDEFVVSDISSDGKDERRFKTLTEFISGKKEKDLGFFDKIKMYWNSIWSGKLFLYKSIKDKAEKEILFWDYGRTKVKKYEDVYHKVEDKVKKGVNFAENLNPELKRAKDVLSNPALKDFITQKNKNVKKIMQDMAKLGPNNFTKALQAEYGNINKGLQKFGSEGVEAVQKGYIPGMELIDGKGVKIPKSSSIKAGGRSAFFRVTAQTLKAAIKNRNWGDFRATVTDPSWISSTAEMLPIYGSIASGKRLNDFSTGTSQSFRNFEFGLNLAFDAITIAPAVVAEVFSFGTATPFIIGARAAAGSGIKSLAKYLSKSSFKNASKIFTKKGGEALAKNSAKSVTKNIWKREIKWALGSEALIMGVEQAINNKHKILNFAINTSSLNKSQKTVLNMANNKIAV